MTIIDAVIIAWAIQPIAVSDVNTTPIQWGPGRLWTVKLTKVESDHCGLLWMTWEVENRHRRLPLDDLAAKVRVVNEDYLNVSSHASRIHQVKPRATETITTNVRLAPGNRSHLLARTTFWIQPDRMSTRYVQVCINYELRYRAGSWIVTRQGRFSPSSSGPNYSENANPMLANWHRRYYDPTK